jgi:beta-alanine degradation protein BauB
MTFTPRRLEAPFMRKTALVPALVLLAFFGLSGVGRTQDPVPLYPENYTVLFENDRVRVLDFRLRKGASEKLHSHPANVAVFLTEVKIKFTLADGQTRMREARAGDISYSEATVHSPVNIGDNDAHGIIVELKTPPSGGNR